MFYSACVAKSKVSNMPGSFRAAIACDFEYSALNGERPQVKCATWRDLKTGYQLQQWQGEFGSAPPFNFDKNTLFIAYNAAAEFSCFLALGWDLPVRVLDLMVEFMRAKNGAVQSISSSLLSALATYGLDSIGGDEKKSMQQLAMRDGPYTNSERAALLAYNQEDVDALQRLLPAMLAAGHIDMPRALLRGRYMAALSRMVHNGTPIDTDILSRLNVHWDEIRQAIVTEVDKDYGVYDGLTFKTDRFLSWLANNDLTWPKLDGRDVPDLKEKTFREMSRVYPIILPLHETRNQLAGLRLTDLHIGSDNRNRTGLWPFKTVTSRNAPSTSGFVFGPAVWLRHIITPPAGHAMAYVDWSSQEFGIAAAMSCDGQMISAYQSGDVYLAFAKQAGAVPSDATKETHPYERELFKQATLAVQYGMGYQSLSLRINESPAKARDLLTSHKWAYPKFWQWSDAALEVATTKMQIGTVFGWRSLVHDRTKPNTLRNFPMQANGAEMMRLAACIATERGIQVNCPVHDAFLMTAPEDQIEEHVAALQSAMAEASRIILHGFELRSDTKIIRCGERYSDPRGVAMWERVTKLLMQCETSSGCIKGE